MRAASTPSKRLAARRKRRAEQERARVDYQDVLDGKRSAASVLGLKPNDARHLIGFAASMLDKDQLETAEAAAEVATEADPSNVDAWLVLGAARARRKEAGLALTAYARAAELDPNNARVWCDIGELKLSLFDYEGAAKALGLALGCDPKAATPGGKRAQALIAKTYAKLAQ